jgi:hypothetical protein
MVMAIRRSVFLRRRATAVLANCRYIKRIDPPANNRTSPSNRICISFQCSKLSINHIYTYLYLNICKIFSFLPNYFDF